MRNEEEKLDQLFAKFDAEWDTIELPKNHENRFIDKLNTKSNKNRKRNVYTTLSIAATLIVMFSLSFFSNLKQKRTNLLLHQKKPNKPILFLMFLLKMN